ncbi:MAG: hypothetical protein LBH97_01795 [Treponema sp.]|jgi:hypothetical protein|nr:hypothetical protein [Treponema sp.]
MKRLEYSVIFAAFLAVLMLSCVVEPPKEIETIRFDPDGRRIVNVGIRFSGGERALGERALNADIARAVVNYYEVLIEEPGTPVRLYRVTGNEKSLYINLPNGLTFNTGGPNRARALVFAGYRRILHKELIESHPDEAIELTLFAIGRVTKVDESTADLTIRASTTSITVSMVALETRVTNAATSDFKVTGPPNYLTSADNFALVTTSIGDAPYFRLPSETKITATPGITATMYVRGIMGGNPYGGASTIPHPATDIYVVKGDCQNTQFVFGGDPVTLEGTLDDTGFSGGLINPATLGANGGFQLKLGTYTEVQVPLGITAGTPAFSNTENTAGSTFFGYRYYLEPLTNYRVYLVGPPAPNTSYPPPGPPGPPATSVGTGTYGVKLINDLWREGWALLSVRIQVSMLGAQVGGEGNFDRHTWWIKTGMYYDRPDQGYLTRPGGVIEEKNSMGGGILVRIGNPLYNPEF